MTEILFDPWNIFD